MKNSILKLLLVLLTLHGSYLLKAQAPNKINYQGIARNVDGSPMANKPLAMRLSIIDGSATGGVVYSEVHSQTTNAFGLYSLGIGTGSVASGSFAAINWASGDKFLKIEMDPNGGSAFVEMGTSQLLSVPLALYANAANNATSATNATTAATATTANSLSPSATINQNQISGTGAAVGQVLKWDGSKWSPKNDSLGTGGSGDNWGTQAVSTNSNFFGNGTSASPLAIAQMSATSGQSLKWNGSAWAPASDNTFDGDSSVSNEIQSLSKNGDTIILNKGGGFVIDNQSWTVSNTANTKAFSKSNNQYVTGNIGVGDFSSSNPSGALHVKGRAIVENSLDVGQLNFNAGNGCQNIGYTNNINNYSNNTLVVGTLNKAEGNNSLLIGENDTLTGGSHSAAIGLKNHLSTNAWNSLAVGKENFINAYSTAVFGEGNKGISYGETSLGLFGTNYTAGSHNSFVDTDRIFNIGNGTALSSRSDALTVLKNGNVGIGSSNPDAKLHLQSARHVKQNIR